MVEVDNCVKRVTETRRCRSARLTIATCRRMSRIATLARYRAQRRELRRQLGYVSPSTTACLEHHTKTGKARYLSRYPGTVLDGLLRRVEKGCLFAASRSPRRKQWRQLFMKTGFHLVLDSRDLRIAAGERAYVIGIGLPMPGSPPLIGALRQN